MNFGALKEYRKSVSSNLSGVVDYLSTELAFTMRELRAGLQKLSFSDNFDSFEAVLSIPVNSEATVVNQLTTIPKGYLILRSDIGGLAVCDGDALWTLERLYLRNTSLTVVANITVRFFK